MSFLKEFKSFALKDNVIELAVAVVIGAAFGDIVSSLVGDVITPLILIPATQAAGVADIDELSWKAVKYGKVLSAVIKFTLIALSLFLVVKAIKKVELPKEKKSE
jgi:large conductance mechanosensitive channel